MSLPFSTTFAVTEAIRIGAGPAAESYLRADVILAVAKQTSAEAIHPGYGFLSENAGFAEADDELPAFFYREALEPTGKTARHHADEVNRSLRELLSR